MAEITKTVVVDAPPSVVFKALTDAKELVQWMPEEAQIDARVGGEYRFRYHWEQREMDAVAKGKILELIPDKRLSYTFGSTLYKSGPNLADPVGTWMSETVVTWTLEQLPDGKTRVTLVQSGITGEGGDNDAGWGYFLARLATLCKPMAWKGK